MALYEYRCSACGPFDVRRGAAASAAGAACPACGTPAARVFSAPGGRAPRRQRQLEGLSGPAGRRVARAQEGAAAIGPLPAGVRLDGGGRPVSPSSGGRDGRRPWQLGH